MDNITRALQDLAAAFKEAGIRPPEVRIASWPEAARLTDYIRRRNFLVDDPRVVITPGDIGDVCGVRISVAKNTPGTGATPCDACDGHTASHVPEPFSADQPQVIEKNGG